MLQRKSESQEQSRSQYCSVFGIFKDRSGAENAVDELRREGFRNSDISVLVPDNGGAENLGHEKHTKGPEGATVGGGTGAAIGGALGWLAALGAISIPGVGPLIAAGPILAAIAGVGMGGVVGALTGALVGIGIPEYEAKRYEGLVKNGGTLISIHSDNSEWTKKAKAILEISGASDISSAGEVSSGSRPGLRSGDPSEGEASGDVKNKSYL